MDEQISFPQHLDSPKPFLLWTADEVIPFTVCMGIGIMARQLTLCLALGFAVVLAWRRIRDTLPDGFAIHWAYWIGFPIRGRSFVNPFIDEVRTP